MRKYASHYLTVSNHSAHFHNSNNNNQTDNNNNNNLSVIQFSSVWAKFTTAEYLNLVFKYNFYGD